MRLFSMQGRRRDYPGAPRSGDEYGYVIVGEGGGTAAGPYTDEELAKRLRDRYAPEMRVQKVRLT